MSSVRAPTARRPNVSEWRSKERNDRLLADPETRELMFADTKDKLRRRDANLPRELDLSPEQYDRLLDVLTEHDFQTKHSVADDGSAVLIREVADQQQREIAAVLGEAKARHYESYAANAPLRWQVRQFRQQLFGANALTDEQASRLAAALGSNREQFMGELGMEPHAAGTGTITFDWLGVALVASDDGGGGAVIEQRIVEQMERYRRRMRQSAASVLTAEQLGAYERFLQDQFAIQRSHLRLRAERIDELAER